MNNAKMLSVGLNVMYRRSIGIKGEKSAVGTINVGFDADPSNVDGAVGRVMKNWAGPNSLLVGYLRDHFELRGPTV